MPKKILLADDSITIQKVVELTFSDGDYEVTAVNNGAKAVAKLAEMRPDIILSDIIMPEKNGYEVCEYVKSHPEYRTIPVVLLTGTFEPFDPDRAEKAGCDAVVTKPFESQSLIHKVEELISQSQSAPAAAPAASAAAAPPAPEPAASPWLDEAPEPPPAVPQAPKPAAAFSPFSSSTEAVPALDLSAYTHGNDIFGGASSSPAGSADLPFDTPASQPPAPSNEQPADPFGASPGAEEFSGETRAFPRMSFEEMRAMASASTPQQPEPVSQVPPPPPAAPEPSPWDEPAPPAPPAFETPAFQTSAPEPEADAPFGAPPPAEEFSGETRAFTKMSFDDLQGMASSQSLPPEPAPAAPPAPEPSPWDEPAEPAAFSGETRAFPKMSFDDLQSMAASPSAPAWSPEEEAPAAPEPPKAEAAPVLEDLPAPEPESVPQPSWSPAEPEPQAEQPQAAASSPALAAASEPSIPISRDLSDEQVDRIARRVVELMSDQVVRNIAWEVIPDLAEVVVKERIRQLESEA